MNQTHEENMTHIYSRLRDYRLNNRGRAKAIIDMVELMLVSVIFPVSIWITRKLFIPEMEVKTFEAIFFFAFILMSWFVLSQVTSMAKIPRTQRYLTLAFQFVRAAFIVFIGLLAVKVLFRLTSIAGNADRYLCGLRLYGYPGVQAAGFYGPEDLPFLWEKPAQCPDYR